MKIKFAGIFLFCLFVIMGGCARVGGQDSLDFIAAMDELGYDCAVEETESGAELSQSCYINGCKLTMVSNSQGKLSRVTLTYTPKSAENFVSLASDCVKVMCEYTDSQAQGVIESLGIKKAPPSNTNGITRCATQWFLFSFTSQKSGGLIQIDSLRLNPTSSPTVTVRTTLPSPEKTEAPS